MRSMEGQIVRVVQDCAAQQSEEMAAHALVAYNTMAQAHNAALFATLLPIKNADGELPPAGKWQGQTCNLLQAECYAGVRLVPACHWQAVALLAKSPGRTQCMQACSQSRCHLPNACSAASITKTTMHSCLSCSASTTSGAMESPTLSMSS